MRTQQWNGYLRQALSPQAIKEQLKPGSTLSRMFLFSLVGAITLGILYNYVGRNLVGTRASTDTLTATTSVSKPLTALNEEFTLNLLLAAPAGKKISQLDLRVNIPVNQTSGDVSYTAGGYESAAVGGTGTNYFDTLVLESLTGTTTDKKFRLVLSSRKKEAELSDKVLVKVKFKGTKNGNVTFTLDKTNMEIVGPGGATTEPVSYTISTSSVISATVTIGGGSIISPTAGPSPIAQITIAPPPACTPSNETTTCHANAACSTSQNVYLPQIFKNADGGAGQFPAPGGPFYSTYAVQNLSDTAAASCKVSYYTQGGALVTSRTLPSIGANKAANVSMLNESQLANGTYSAVISCNQQIAVVSTFVDSDGGSGSGAYRGIGTGSETPSATWYLSSIYNNYYSYYSNVVVQNPSSTQTTAAIHIYNDKNVQVYAASKTIPGNGAVVFTQHNLPASQLGVNQRYSAKITSTAPVAVAGNIYGWRADNSIPNGQLFVVTGTRSGSKIAYAPVIMNNYYGYNSALSIQNLGTSPANYTITYSVAGSAQSIVKTGTIQPNAKFESYVPNADSGVPAGNNLVSATVTADQPIALLVNESDPSNRASSYTGFSQGSTKMFVPIVTNSDNNVNSSISCQNIGSTAATMHIAYSNAAGTVISERATNAIAANQTNLFYPPNIIEKVPVGFNGSAVITSSQPIVCVVNQNRDVAPWRTDPHDFLTTYEAIGQPAPAGASTGTNVCACKAGYNNCDNNWTNGCETAGACSAGGACTNNSQCLSNNCQGNRCQLPVRVTLTSTPPVTPPPVTPPPVTPPPGSTLTPTKIPTAGPSPIKTPTKVPTAGPSPTKVPSATPTKTPTPSPKPGTPTVTPPPIANGNVTLDIKVKFNGIGANLTPVKDTQKVKVTLANPAMKVPVSQIVEFKIAGQSAQNIRIFEGKATFTNIPVGSDYSIFIKGAQQIQKRVCQNTPTEAADGRYICTDGNITLVAGNNVLDFSNIYQLGGDLPVSNAQSGFVDAVDITFVRSNLGKKDPAVLAVADLNFDGIVDTQDYAISLYSLSFKYDEEAVGNQ